MINCKYGYVSPVEAKIFGELDRDLRRKKQMERRSKDKTNTKLIKEKRKSHVYEH